jgi:hypothetical protein
MVVEARAVALPSAAAIVEKVVIEGDLSKLSAAERIGYYRHMCETLGIEPMLRPFEYLMLNGKLVLYANKQGASQLRDKRNVSIGKPDITFADDLVTVAVEARLPDGRTDAELGVVSVAGLKGEAKANAILKAVTKAKRRVTLSICGLGMLDETEVQDVAGAQPVRVDMATGEVQPAAPQPVPQNGDTPFVDFIADPKALKGFWTWAKGLGLTEDDVHVALNVDSLKDATGTKAQVKATVESFAKTAAAQQAKEDLFPGGK